MRRIGFSTGALAKGDFVRGLKLQGEDCKAVELSALRENELDGLIEALPNLPLGHIEYVSLHAPSRIVSLTEKQLVLKLKSIMNQVDGIVVHPDIIKETSIWESLEDKLLLENMDQRKPIGRTADELQHYFKALPNARFCLDLGHALQVDPTQGVTVELLNRNSSRLAELHISSVDIFSKHIAISSSARSAFQRIAPRLPSEIPVIIESVISPDKIDDEIKYARGALENIAVPH
ncbi:hypothetical protein MNBD_PLANCTO02-3364 [hydrothermal vent metagenome]|uniref:Xylose isomerase-like TIM barrel domain-containing protein n=1 Tax=hydrothermal vent metagenome TaxID=652676 RepID=A0A3B1E3G2_9ZZZZ